MGKKKTVDFDPRKLSPQEKLKFEIARERGLESRVMEGGWRGRTAKESGGVGGVTTKKKREMKEEALRREEG